MKKMKRDVKKASFLLILALCFLTLAYHTRTLHVFAQEQGEDQSHIKNRVKVIPKYGEGVKKIDYEEVKKMQERANLTQQQLKELEEKEAKEKEQKRIEEENKKITDGTLDDTKLKEELANLKPPYRIEDLEKFRESVDTTAQAKRISIKVLEKEHEDVEKLADFNNYTGSDRVTAIARNKKKNIDPLISKAKLEDEKRSLEYHKRMAAVELEKLLMDDQVAKLELDYLKEKLKYVQSLYEADKIKLSLGKITQIELLESENTLEEARDALKKAEDNRFRLSNELRRKLGFSLHKELEISYELKLKEDIEAYLIDRLQSAIFRQPELIEKEEKRDYTKLIFEDIRTFYKNYDKEYIQAEADYKVALMEYNDVYNKLLLDFNSDLKKLNSQKKFYELALENRNLVEKARSNQKMKYGQGKISSLELDKAYVDLSQANLNIAKELAKYNYQRDVLKLKLEFSYQ